MNLKELLSETILDFDFEKFNAVFAEHYPKDNPYVYVTIMQKVLEKDVEDNKDNQIALRFYEDNFDPNDVFVYADVGLDVMSEKKHYSLSFIPWKEIAGFGVDNIIREYVETGKLSKEEVVAHILQEITFYGFEEDVIEEQANELTKTIEEFHRRKDEPGYLNEFKTWEQLKEKLESLEKED